MVRHRFPASTGIVVGLLIPGMFIELEAIALRGSGRIVERVDVAGDAG